MRQVGDIGPRALASAVVVAAEQHSVIGIGTLRELGGLVVGHSACRSTGPGHTPSPPPWDTSATCPNSSEPPTAPGAAQPNPTRHQPATTPNPDHTRPKTRQPAQTHQPSSHPAPTADPTNPSVDSGLHVAIDDYSRVAYVEAHDNETAATLVGFWRRAQDWFWSNDMAVDEVLTDNGPNFVSGAFAELLAERAIVHRRTRPYRPQTNGKAERFNRTLTDEFLYNYKFRSETERRIRLKRWIHDYNCHRHHTAIGGPPASRANNLTRTDTSIRQGGPYGDHETDESRRDEAGLLGQRRIDVSFQLGKFSPQVSKLGTQLGEICAETVFKDLEVVIGGEMIPSVRENAFGQRLDGLRGFAVYTKLVVDPGPTATIPTELRPPMATMPTELTPPNVTRPIALIPPIVTIPIEFKPPSVTIPIAFSQLSAATPMAL